MTNSKLLAVMLVTGLLAMPTIGSAAVDTGRGGVYECTSQVDQPMDYGGPPRPSPPILEPASSLTEDGGFLTVIWRKPSGVFMRWYQDLSTKCWYWWITK